MLYMPPVVFSALNCADCLLFFSFSGMRELCKNCLTAPCPEQLSCECPRSGEPDPPGLRMYRSGKPDPPGLRMYRSGKPDPPGIREHPAVDQ